MKKCFGDCEKRAVSVLCSTRCEREVQVIVKPAAIFFLMRGPRTFYATKGTGDLEQNYVKTSLTQPKNKRKDQNFFFTLCFRIATTEKFAYLC